MPIVLLDSRTTATGSLHCRISTHRAPPRDGGDCWMGMTNSLSPQTLAAIINYDPTNRTPRRSTNSSTSTVDHSNFSKVDVTGVSD